jgi:hypothetical protein
MTAQADFGAVLAAAERLQRLVPDAVLVGGTAAAIYAAHRVSFGADHVLGDLGRPLEVAELVVDGHVLRVPTEDEMLRVKAWMIVYRNSTRDFVDVAALASRFGMAQAGRVLARYLGGLGMAPVALVVTDPNGAKVVRLHSALQRRHAGPIR